MRTDGKLSSRASARTNIQAGRRGRAGIQQFPESQGITPDWLKRGYSVTGDRPPASLERYEASAQTGLHARPTAGNGRRAPARRPATPAVQNERCAAGYDAAIQRGQ